MTEQKSPASNTTNWPLQTTPQARASIVIDSLDRDYTNLDGTWRNRSGAIDFIGETLRTVQREARRTAWEEAIAIAGTAERECHQEIERDDRATVRWAAMEAREITRRLRKQARKEMR